MATFKIIYKQGATVVTTKVNGQLTADEYFKLCLDQAKAMGYYDEPLKRAINKIKKGL